MGTFSVFHGTFFLYFYLTRSFSNFLGPVSSVGKGLIKKLFDAFIPSKEMTLVAESLRSNRSKIVE